MSLRHPCASCHREMLLEKVHEGFEVPCPSCGHRFLVAAGTVGDDPSPAFVPGPRPHCAVADDGTIPLLLGILGIFVCVAAPVAWVMAHRLRAGARREGRDAGSTVMAAFVLGIVGTVLWLAAGALLGLFFALLSSVR